MVFGSVIPWFFLTVWFQRERCEALLDVAIIGHAFSLMVRSAGGEYHRSRDMGTINDDWTLRTDVELAW
jgi:hypothetical protein